MDTNKIFGVDGAGQPIDPQRAPKQGDEAEFRRVLERLEEISRQTKPPGDVANTENFLEAMRKADQDFMSVMDMRRKLEQAYRDRES